MFEVSGRMRSEMLRTVRGRKSRIASPLAAAIVERTTVSSIPKTTAPLAKRAISPVSSVIKREPISNSSLKVSSTLVPALAESSLGLERAEDEKKLRVLDLHVQRLGTEETRGFLALETRRQIAIVE